MRIGLTDHLQLDPQLAALLQDLNQPRKLALCELTVEEARHAAEKKPRLVPYRVRSFDLSVPGGAGPLPVRIYAPDTDEMRPLVIFFHGGGWVIGGIEEYDSTCGRLADLTGCVFASVEYRLAPEYKFPAAVEDCFAASKWLSAHASMLGCNSEAIAVAGDSAGGNLAAVVSLLARDAHDPKLAFQALIYPTTDLHHTAQSHASMYGDELLTHADTLWFRNHYLRSDADANDWRASPLLAIDHSGLPPALVAVAGHDPLRDEGVAYALALRRAGVEVKIRTYYSLAHGFLAWTGIVDRATVAELEIADDLRSGLERTVRA